MFTVIHFGTGDYDFLSGYKLGEFTGTEENLVGSCDEVNIGGIC